MNHLLNREDICAKVPCPRKLEAEDQVERLQEQLTATRQENQKLALSNSRMILQIAELERKVEMPTVENLEFQLSAALQRAETAERRVPSLTHAYERFRHLDALLTAVEDGEDPLHMAARELWIAVKEAQMANNESLIGNHNGNVPTR